jgi:recombination protein RecA
VSKPSAAAIKKFEESFRKSYGDEALRRSDEVRKYTVISTGSVVLDYRTGVGGYVRGRIVEIWGPEGVGKTTLSMEGLASAQRMFPDEMIGFIDMEQRWDDAWADAHGIDRSKLYLVTPDSAEDVADALKDMLRSGIFSMVVVDSIGAMIPEAEKEKDADSAVMAMQAKIVTRMVKIAAVEARRNNVVVLLINQVRANLSYGAETTTGGGFALKHCTTMKMKMRNTGTTPFKAKVRGEELEVGREIAVKVERNSVAPKGRTAQFTLFSVETAKYGPVGIDRADEAATLGIETGIIDQSGAWYTFSTTGERLQGRDAVVKALRDQPGLIDGLRAAALNLIADQVHEDETPVITEKDIDEEPKSRKARLKKGATTVMATE